MFKIQGVNFNLYVQNDFLKTHVNNVFYTSKHNIKFLQIYFKYSICYGFKIL